ncbi:MAG: hypothetical protein AAF081_05040, partial [Actinomycetota bacterium]
EPVPAAEPMTDAPADAMAEPADAMPEPVDDAGWDQSEMGGVDPLEMPEHTEPPAESLGFTDEFEVMPMTTDADPGMADSPTPDEHHQG